MQYLKYIGPVHRKIITAQDWRMAGVSDQETVEWSWVNGFSVPLDSLSDKAQRVIEEHEKDNFVVLGGEDNAPKFLGTVMTPAEAAAPRVDMMGVVGGSSGSAGLSGGSTGAPGGAAPTTTATGPGSGSD